MEDLAASNGKVADCNQLNVVCRRTDGSHKTLEKYLENHLTSFFWSSQQCLMVFRQLSVVITLLNYINYFLSND